jgi:hypothetical protein
VPVSGDPELLALRRAWTRRLAPARRSTAATSGRSSFPGSADAPRQVIEDLVARWEAYTGRRVKRG